MSASSLFSCPQHEVLKNVKNGIGLRYPRSSVRWTEDSILSSHLLPLSAVRSHELEAAHQAEV